MARYRAHRTFPQLYRGARPRWRSMSQLASLSACQTPLRSGMHAAGSARRLPLAGLLRRRRAARRQTQERGVPRYAPDHVHRCRHHSAPSAGSPCFLHPLASRACVRRAVCLPWSSYPRDTRTRSCRCVALLPGELARVRRLVVRVVHGEVVQQARFVDGAVALHDAQPRTRIVRPHEVLEVGGLHHQRIALPVADGVAAVGDHVFGQMLRVQPDRPRPVHPLDHDQHMVVALHDGLHVVVGGGASRDGERHVETAVADGQALRVVVRIGALRKPPGLARILGLVVRSERRAARLARLRDGRAAAVGRIDDDRRAVLAVDLVVVAVMAAAVEPVPVVAARRIGSRTVDAAVPRLPFERLQALAVGVQGRDRLVDAGMGKTLELLDLLRGVRHPLTQIGIALHPRQTGDVIRA